MRRGCQLSGRPRARPASLRCPLLQGPLALFLWGSWGQAPEPAQHKPLPCRWGAETARIPRVPTQKVGLESLTAALRVPGSPRKAGGFHDVGQGHIVGPYVVLPHVQAQDPAEVPAGVQPTRVLRSTSVASATDPQQTDIGCGAGSLLSAPGRPRGQESQALCCPCCEAGHHAQRSMGVSWPRQPNPEL